MHQGSRSTLTVNLWCRKFKREYVIPVGYNTISKERCVDRIVSGSETGMAISYLQQLLDCVPFVRDDDTTSG